MLCRCATSAASSIPPSWLCVSASIAELNKNAEDEEFSAFLYVGRCMWDAINRVRTRRGNTCINNVAIGAAYTLNKYRNEIKKIAIFDFDVHHGNGTEEIIQMLNYKKFSKTFEYDKNISINIENTKQINWLDCNDAQNLLFISTHIYDKANEKNFIPILAGQKQILKKLVVYIQVEF